MKKKIYGLQLDIELFGCEYKIMRSKKKIEKFLREATHLTGLKTYGEPIVKRFMGGNGWEEGYSAFQFLTSSSITVHCIEPDKVIFISVFSCGVFDAKVMADFTKSYFRAKWMKTIPLTHKEL